MRAAEGFGPAEFARVALHFEVGVAFAAAEAELFCVVADEGDALAGVAGAGAEVAGFDPHFGRLCGRRVVVVRVKSWKLFRGREKFSGSAIRSSDLRGDVLTSRETDFESASCLHFILSAATHIAPSVPTLQASVQMATALAVGVGVAAAAFFVRHLASYHLDP